MQPEKLYYFDNNATTRVAPEVLEAMLPFLTEKWGNPSSVYRFGRDLAKVVEQARAQVACLINADPKEIIFTSCGTESNNSALHSAWVTQPGKRHFLTTAVEHSATLNYAKFLQKQGYDVTFLPVRPDGSLDLHLLEKSLRPDTALVSIISANNETGVLFPIPEIAAICRFHNILLHTDTVQAPGKLKLHTKDLGVDFLSLSAHKLYAPKGIGLLYVNRRAKYQPYIIGGHQEYERRAGTENVAYIVGFGRAAELALSRLDEVNSRIRRLRDRMENSILTTIPKTSRNGAPEPRLPNTSNLAFEGVEAEALLLKLDQAAICASSGSACTTGSLEPSHVLTAMGLSRPQARSSIRLSLGVYNTDGEVDYLLQKLPPIVAQLRVAAPGR